MFDGETFDFERDFNRLDSQLNRVFALMKDGKWRTLREIADACAPATETSISARIRDLRKEKFGEYKVLSTPTDRAGVWKYKLVLEEPTGPYVRR